MKPAIIAACLLAAAPLAAWAQPATGGAGALRETAAGRFATLALACLHQEYPNKIAHVLASDADVQAPRALTPAFYGCYDWHSSVHGHWLLARLARVFPRASFAAPARAALARSLIPEHIAAEAKYLAGAGRASFERPYGLAWLLQLAAELREWESPEAREWSATLRPLEDAAVVRLSDWLPKLSKPIRIGEHDQTAFSFALMLDWARRARRADFESLLASRIRAFYLQDRGCPFGWEPSGQDFLSPCLAEADLVRRVMPAGEFAAWLEGFLPGIPVHDAPGWLEVVVVADPSDPKLAHLDGLNLSRAWMLEGIASALPPGDRRLPALQGAADRHREAGLRAVTGEHYEGGHWLGSFAVYLTTGRGLKSP